MPEQFHSQVYSGIVIRTPDEEGKIIELPVYDPIWLANEMSRTGEGDPTMFTGLANSFTDIAGRESSQGWFLMLYEDLIKLEFTDFSTSVKMYEKTLEEINSSQYGSPLVSAEVERELTIEKLGVMSALGVTALVGNVGGDTGLNEQMYLVMLGDQRQFSHMTTISKGYNVRTPAHNPEGYEDIYDADMVPKKHYYSMIDASLACGNPNEVEYYKSSLNDDEPWSFSEMVQDIWDHLPSELFELGGNGLTEARFPEWHYHPELDPTDGHPRLDLEDIKYVPENYQFWGISAWDALHRVLADVDHVILRNHDGTFRIVDAIVSVEAGVVPEDLALQAKKEKAENHIIDLRKPFGNVEIPVTSLPRDVRVFFPRKDFGFHIPFVLNGATYDDDNVLTANDLWKCNPLYSVDIRAKEGIQWQQKRFAGHKPDLLDTAVPSSIEGTIYPIHSSTFAHFHEDGGDPLNLHELRSEAHILASQYYQSINNGADARDGFLYSGLWDFEQSSFLKSITWSDRGNGLTTSISNSRRPVNRGKISRSGNGGGYALNHASSTALEFPGPPDHTRPHEPPLLWVECQTLEKIDPGGYGTAVILKGANSGALINWSSAGRHVCLHNFSSDSFIPSGAKGFAYFCKQVRRWVCMAFNFDPCVVIFELTACLPVGGCAMATVVACSAGNLPVGTAIPVDDSTMPDSRAGLHTGQFGPAAIGDRGVAFRHKCETGLSCSSDCAYTIINMEHQPIFAKAVLTSSLAGGTAGATISTTWQGRKGNMCGTNTVRDLCGLYTDLDTDDCVIVSFDEVNSTCDDGYWNIIDAEQGAAAAYHYSKEICADVTGIGAVTGFNSVAGPLSFATISVNKDSYLRLFQNAADATEGLVSIDPIGTGHGLFRSIGPNVRWSEAPSVGKQFSIGTRLNIATAEQAWLKLHGHQTNADWFFSADLQTAVDGSNVVDQKWLVPSRPAGSKFEPGSNLTIGFTGDTDGDDEANQCLKLKWTKPGIGDGTIQTITGLHTNSGYYISLWLDDGVIWKVTRDDTLADIAGNAVKRTDSGAAICTVASYIDTDPCP